jgi:hypothetical protein
MLSFTPAENFANYVQEARSMNVPQFILTYEWKPEWWAPSSGMVADVSCKIIQEITEKPPIVTMRTCCYLEIVLEIL